MEDARRSFAELRACYWSMTGLPGALRRAAAHVRDHGLVELRHLQFVIWEDLDGFEDRPVEVCLRHCARIEEPPARGSPGP